jgi:hypothetical protein
MPTTKVKRDDKSVEASVQAILDSMEIEAIDPQARRALERIFYLKMKFGKDAEGHIVLLVRTIAESANGPAALVPPIVDAVSLCMEPRWTSTGLRWLEAWDELPLLQILEQMRGLDLFAESSLCHYLGIALRNKLAKIFEPAAAKPAERKQPASITRAPGVEKSIRLGFELLALRSEIKHNATFGHRVRRRFDVDTKTAARAMLVARVFGSKPAIYSRLSWIALVTLASPTMPAAVRAALEARIVSGERIGAPEIRRARRARAARADATKMAA